MDTITPQSKWGDAIKFTAVVLALIGLVYLIVYLVRTNNVRSTPGNIKDIKTQQLAVLEPRWVNIKQGKTSLETQFATIPADQRLLINANILAMRLVGYLGPFSSGVFDEDGAVRLALNSGARCLILEIDYENGKYEPVLVYRDGWGIKRSLDSGSIQKVAKSIAARAFNPTNDGVPSAVAKDPLILVTYIVRAPNQGSKPREYLRFLGAIAEQLQPLQDLLVGQTPQGDFRRQQLESQLFFTNWQAFQGRIIHLTNADTSGFRRLDSLGLRGDLGSKQDLDFMVHATLYSKESPSPFGISSGPTSSIRPAAVITTPNYWLNTPPDRAKEAADMTKQAWTLVMEPVSSDTNQMKAEIVDKLIKEYGTHCIATTLFIKEEQTAVLNGKDRPFANSTWAAKPELLRYIPPRAIPIQKPYPQANSGGGAVVAPKL